MDQCTRCSCHGDVEACETTQCTYHDLWYVKHLRARIAALKQAESGGSAATNRPHTATPPEDTISDMQVELVRAAIVAYMTSPEFCRVLLDKIRTVVPASRQ